MIIAGRKTGVFEHGTGAPALMLHCALARAKVLGRLMNGLDDRLEMLAVDLPGHGLTKFDPDLDIQDQAVETAVLLLQRNKAKAHLFGHSFGATVALRLALEHPDLVASLSLYEPVYFSLLAKTNPAAYAQEARESAAFSRAAVAGNWEEAALEFLARWGGESYDLLPAQQRAYILKTIPLIVSSQQSIIEPAKGGLILNGLAGLTMPVMLMHGGQSPVVIRQIIDVLAARIPTTQVRVFAGAAHMGPISHAVQVGDTIRKFIG